MADALAMDASDDQAGKKEPSLNKYFNAVIKMQVSDLHLKADRPAYVRTKGDLRPLTGGPLTDEQIRAGIFELLTEEQKQLYHDNGAVDFAHDVGPPGDNEITSVIRASYDAGMIDFTEHIRQLVETGFIDHETAYDAASNPDELKMALKGIRSTSAAILG